MSDASRPAGGVFNPTSGVLMAVLATSGTPYLKWVRFIAPLLLAWFVTCIVAIALGVAAQQA